LSSSNWFSEKTISLESRKFSLRILNFENGSFVSVTEGNNKIGSMMVSLATGPIPITTTVIPSRSNYVFLKLIAEKISSNIKGIAIVSVFTKNELETKITKAIISEIMDMIKH
jgi:hypothetical protein